jgi:hypothetical protein
MALFVTVLDEPKRPRTVLHGRYLLFFHQGDAHYTRKKFIWQEEHECRSQKMALLREQDRVARLQKKLLTLRELFSFGD